MAAGRRFRRVMIAVSPRLHWLNYWNARPGIAVLFLALASSCGYVGEPLPPALNIAAPIRDLRAVEYGDNIIVNFTIPSLTTDGLALKRIGAVDLRAGPGGNPFDANRWAAEAKRIPVAADSPGAVEARIPAAEFLGREIVVGVRLVNPKGRPSEWSNLVVIAVAPPLARPAGLKAEATAGGVKLSWQGAAPGYRVYRSVGSEKPVLIGNSDRPEYLDATAEYGKTYSYIVQGVRGASESEISAPYEITPVDRFAPAIPTGLTAVTGISSIELVWERNTEPDLRGYRVYRALDDGPLRPLSDIVDTPSYSDRQIEAGKHYRYAVTSIDQAGNESGKSAVVEAVGPEQGRSGV